MALIYLRGPDAPEGDDLVDTIYSGPKATLRPFYDEVIATVHGFVGTVGPASGGRLEIGLNLKDVEPSGRLERATGMCTHRVRLDDPAAFDAEVRSWLREAYDRAG